MLERATAPATRQWGHAPLSSVAEVHYSEQISRAYRARGRESEQLWRERVCLEAQQQLPVTDPPF